MTDAGDLPLSGWPGHTPDAGAAAVLVVDAEERLAHGDLDGAVASFRTAWDLVQDDPGAAATVAACLRVLLHLGNIDRAVDLVLPRLGWLTVLPTPRDQMWFAATAALVLEQGDAVGLAPRTVDGRPVGEVVTDLRGAADEIAADLDARDGSHSTARALAAAHDTSLVRAEPTLPPTRLPRPGTPAPSGAGPDAVPRAADVVARARALSEAIASLSSDLGSHTDSWLRDRTALVPPSTREEWSAVSLLDRVSAQQAGDPVRHRELLALALEAAQRADDTAGATRSEGELALLDVVEATGPATTAAAQARARAYAVHLDASGDHEEAAGLWRRIAWFGRPADPAVELGRAARAYQRSGLVERRLLCLIEAAAATSRTDPARAGAMLDVVGPEVAGRPELSAMVLDVRARAARATGDLGGAREHLQRALGIRGVGDRVRLTALLTLCEVLVEQEAWPELEGPGADLVAAATRDHDPLLLAHAQRFLGLAYAETDRPAEAVELLEAALPVVTERGPGLVGPVAWALGNALEAQGRWRDACAAFATASSAFTSQGRLVEAAHAHLRAGSTAWEADDVDAAAMQFDAAAEMAQSSGTVGLYVEALRSAAALRAETLDLDGGIAELDAVIGAGRLLAAAVGAGEDEFDGEVLEPHVLRQGAHLLASHGRVDDAVERLARAQSLVGAELEVVLRAEVAMVLADHDRLAEAEPGLRASVAELHAAGLVEERVDAAGALARALDRAGRTDEADDLWQRHGPGPGPGPGADDADAEA